MLYLQRTCTLLIIALSFASCSNKEGYTAYFGGQVTNARVPYILFSKADKVLDTIVLDKNNRFSVKFDSLTPGMYSFKYDTDYQYVYFDKNDSIVVNFDSDDFDHTVVFSGRGERKNNFMVELYTLNESDRYNAYDLYDLHYKQFITKIDSVYAARKAFYNKSRKDIEWSEDFDFYARARTDFSYFSRKEYYPYIHARRTGENIKSMLPSDYYSFRKKINFNDKRLVTFSPFLRYLNSMLNNMAITRNYKGGNLKEDALKNNIDKLNIADSIFKDPAAKNDVLNSIAFNYLLEDQNILNNQKFLERYMQLSTDDSKDNEIRKIGAASKNLKEGGKLPEVKLVDVNNKPVDLAEGTDKQTVIFFWTSCARTHLENVYEHVEMLKQKHPDVHFVAVNVDKDTEWKRVMAQQPFTLGTQLRALDFRELKDKWVFTKINRTIILNPDGTIKKPFTDILDPKFGSEL
jgi:peroxiredoxin